MDSPQEDNRFYHTSVYTLLNNLNNDFYYGPVFGEKGFEGREEKLSVLADRVLICVERTIPPGDGKRLRDSAPFFAYLSVLFERAILIYKHVSQASFARSKVMSSDMIGMVRRWCIRVRTLFQSYRRGWGDRPINWATTPLAEHKQAFASGFDMESAIDFFLVHFAPSS